MPPLQVVAYAGTGDVLKIQKMLHLCSEHYEVSKDDTKRADKKDKAEAGAKKLEAEAGRWLQAVGVCYSRDLSSTSFSAFLKFS